MSLENLSDSELIKYYRLFKKVKDYSSKRAEKVKNQEYDYNFAYHIVRLLNEVEQILVEHDLDLQRNREQLKSIRRGEWKFEDIEKYFEEKEKNLEKIYVESSLRQSPDEDSIKTLLLHCLEEHYGSLSNAVVVEDKAVRVLRQVKELVENY